jgi:CRISPR/Cas system CSM-associated protein Csm2 small subunit
MIKKEVLADDETSRLVDEISELKEILREVSRQLNRIETKVKRRGISATSKVSETIVSQPDETTDKTVGLSAEQVLQIYEQLRLKAKNGKEEEVRKKLLSMTATDLSLICLELGMPPTAKNPSRKKMIEVILGRIKQSLMLSRHIDRQAL